MNMRTRHIGVMCYSGLAAIVLAQGHLNDIMSVAGLLSPIAALFGVDKIEAIVRNRSNKNSDTA
jgi:hypothetical protein